MGILSDGRVLEPLKEAQEDINVRLDAILIELRHLHVILEELLGVMSDPTPKRRPARKAG